MIGRITPANTTKLGHTDCSRTFFARGHAAFMRNWPYAVNEARKAGMEVGVSELPGSIPGISAGVLGGWGWSVSRCICLGPHAHVAESLALHIVCVRVGVGVYSDFDMWVGVCMCAALCCSIGMCYCPMSTCAIVRRVYVCVRACARARVCRFRFHTHVHDCVIGLTR